jgi:hypothetical protein
MPKSGPPIGPETAQYMLRIDRAKLERLEEIASAEHRTLPGQLRYLIDEHIAAYESSDKAAA